MSKLKSALCSTGHGTGTVHVRELGPVLLARRVRKVAKKIARLRRALALLEHAVHHSNSGSTIERLQARVNAHQRAVQARPAYHGVSA